MWTWLLVLFAGSYAQALACGRKVDRVLKTSGKLDLREAEPAIDWLLKRGHVRSSLEALTATHLATCMFLAERWPAIERVARALQNSGRLTGREVRSLVKNGWIWSRQRNAEAATGDAGALNGLSGEEFKPNADLLLVRLVCERHP